MSDEIRLEGLGLAPGVLETIVTLAAQEVEGVAHVGSPGLAGLVNKSGARGTAARPIEITVDDQGAIHVAVHIEILYGSPLRKVARAVQQAVGDAVLSQVGTSVKAVDVFVDGIEFGS